MMWGFKVGGKEYGGRRGRGDEVGMRMGREGYIDLGVRVREGGSNGRHTRERGGLLSR